MATWILNDETKANVYGFRVRNAGIDLERFRANPVMLAMHRDWDLDAIIGRWTNIRIEGNLLLADDEFDMEDEKAKAIAGKAKRGFIKAVSMGFLWAEEFMEKALDGVFDLVQSELIEASLVTIPGNANAVRLYAAPGQLMEDKEIKLSLSSLRAQSSGQPKTETNMEKFKLSGTALTALLSVGLTNQEDPTEVNNAIMQLGARLKKEQDDHAATKDALKVMKDAQLAAVEKNANDAVNAAILAGKLTAAQKEQYVKLYLSDAELAKGILDNMPGKSGLAASAGGNAGAGNPDDPKSLDDFQKMPLQKQLAFKENNPEGYQALFS